MVVVGRLVHLLVAIIGLICAIPIGCSVRHQCSVVQDRGMPLRGQVPESHSVLAPRVLSLRGGNDGANEHSEGSMDEDFTEELYSYEGRLLQLLKKGDSVAKLLDVQSGELMWERGIDSFLLKTILKESERTFSVPSWLKSKVKRFPSAVDKEQVQKVVSEPTPKEPQVAAAKSDQQKPEVRGDDQPAEPDPDEVERVLQEMIPDDLKQQLFAMYEQALEAEAQANASGTSVSAAAAK